MREMMQMHDGHRGWGYSPRKEGGETVLGERYR